MRKQYHFRQLFGTCRIWALQILIFTSHTIYFTQKSILILTLVFSTVDIQSSPVGHFAARRLKTGWRWIFAVAGLIHPRLKSVQWRSVKKKTFFNIWLIFKAQWDKIWKKSSKHIIIFHYGRARKFKKKVQAKKKPREMK